MFKIQEKGKPETAVWLNESAIFLASDGSGQFLLENNNDNDEETLIKIKLVLENDRPYLCDMTFNTKIIINGNAIPSGSKKLVNHGDSIQIGASIFDISNPQSVVNKLQSNKENAPAEEFWRLKAIGNWLDGQVFVIKGKTIVGRDASCTITIPGSHLSRRHAEFIPVGSKLAMRDLDSANGSFHNGNRCKEAHLENGDEIKLDVLNFKVMAPESLLFIENKKSQAKENSNKKLDSIPLPSDGDKNWVTKPTSIGNTSFDPHDALLAKHIKTKKIIYASIGIIGCLVLVIGLILLN